MITPDSDEIEITIFGPGYGESIIIHVGSGKWIIVDSCLNDAGKSASITYLKSLGVNPSEAVKFIAVSHWHDDHIKGLADTVRQRRSAQLEFSSVLSKQEFLAFMLSFEEQFASKVD